MVIDRENTSDDSEFVGDEPAFLWMHYAWTLAFLAVLSFTNYYLIPYVGYRATGFGFLVGVLPIAVAYGLGPALLFAALSALIWDYFFIPPQFTLSIQASEDVMMNLTYFVVALVSGFSGSRIRRHERALKARELKAKLLYRIEKCLAEKNSVESVLEESISLLKSRFGVEAVILQGDEDRLRQPEEAVYGIRLSEAELEHAKWVYRNEKRAGNGTHAFSESLLSFYPLSGNESATGVLVVDSDLSKNRGIEPVLREICAIIGVAIERETHRATLRRNALLEASEKLHQTLLDSVSHELRTPLTTILGTANCLALEPLPSESASYVLELKSSAERLNQTVTNLLDMSRISSGALLLNRALIDLSDFIRTCVGRSAHLLTKNRVTIRDSKEALYVLGDEKVLEIAFANLLGNAACYSPEGSEIRISVRGLDRLASIEIANHGAGIRPGEEEAVFGKFYSKSGAVGLGLGLAIVREVIDLHLGEVRANTVDGLTVFSVLLPREELPDRLKEELQTL